VVDLGCYRPLRQEAEQGPANGIRVLRIGHRPCRAGPQMPLDQPDRGREIGGGNRIISQSPAAEWCTPVQSPQHLGQVLVVRVGKLLLERLRLSAAPRPVVHTYMVGADMPARIGAQVRGISVDRSTIRPASCVGLAPARPWMPALTADRRRCTPATHSPAEPARKTTTSNRSTGQSYLCTIGLAIPEAQRGRSHDTDRATCQTRLRSIRTTSTMITMITIVPIPTYMA